MSSMLQIRNLLNPVTPEPSDASSDEAYSRGGSRHVVGGMSGRHSGRAREWSSKQNQQRGPVNFMPFEEGLSAEMLRQIERFQVRPFGQIRQSCEHIPYNSSKKDFFGKTGRESIDVLKYEFRLPGEETDYTVMWDYDVGLVRITPFFKCMGFAKTKPSQMLDKNPGLRDITPSITGGAVSAQAPAASIGYWMPYKCARAVCATFCYTIAPALVPLFGPSFPSECRVPGRPRYRDMTIDQDVIADAARDSRAALVEAARRNSSSSSSQSQPQPSSSNHPSAAVSRHVMEPRLRQQHAAHSHQPAMVPSEAMMKLAHPSPQRLPPVWTSINAAPSPITPPRSSSSPRPALSGNVDSFHRHRYVDDPDRGMVLVGEPPHRPHHRHHREGQHHHQPQQHHQQQHHHQASPERPQWHHGEHPGREYPTPARVPLPPVTPEGYGTKRRFVSPLPVRRIASGGEHSGRPLSRNETNSPRKRAHREDAPRRIEDYHAASALVGLQGEVHRRSRG